MKSIIKALISIAGLVSIALVVFCCKGNIDKTQANEVNIGGVFSMTGAGANYGSKLSLGIQAAIDEVNKGGGIGGKQVKYTIEDSKSETKSGILAVNKMLSMKDSPQVIFSNLSNVSLAIKPITEENQKILISLAGDDNLLDDSKYVFRNYVDPVVTGRNAARGISGLNVKTIGIIFMKNDWGESTENSLVEALESTENVEVVFSAPYNVEENNFKPLIIKNLSLKPDYIHVVGYGANLGLLVKQIRELGYDGKVGGDVSLISKAPLEAAGKSMDNAYYLDFKFDVLEGNNEHQNFLKIYDKYVPNRKDEDKLDAFFVIGYESARIVLEQMKACNFSCSEDDLLEKLENVRDFNGVFYPIDIFNKTFQHSQDFEQYKYVDK